MGPDIVLSTEMAVFPSLTFGVAVVVVLWFVWDQQRIGRFGGQAPLAPASDWFDMTLARFPAEVVGAAWDDTVSAKEVKAILTRLILEEKLSADVRKADGSEMLVLRLLVPRTSFRGYEGLLVSSLFPSGETTDFPGLERFYVTRDRLDPKASKRLEVGDLPDLLSTHKFDPAEQIRPLLLAEADKVTAGTYLDDDVSRGSSLFSSGYQGFSFEGRPLNPHNFLTFGYLAPVVGALVLGGVDDHSGLAFVVGYLLYFAAKRQADRLRQRPVLHLASLLRLSPVLAVWLLEPTLAAVGIHLPWPLATWLSVLALGSVVSVVVLARATGTKQQLTARKGLEGARELLLREATATGSVPDSWLPYVFAFGLENLVPWDTDRAPAAFAACGGITGWNRLVRPFAVPFVTRAAVSLD